MRSIVTALNLVLPSDVMGEPSDDEIVRDVEEKLHTPILEQIKKMSLDAWRGGRVHLPKIQSSQASLLGPYSATDAMISASFLKVLEDSVDEPSRSRLLKQRGVRPVMMTHDEITFEISHDEV